MIEFFIEFVFWVLYLYSGASTLYLLIMAVAGKTARKSLYNIHSDKKKIAVIIPAYKEDLIIIDTVSEAFSHNYPPDYFKVIVIADRLNTETVIALEGMHAQVLEVQFEVSMKAKSIHAALECLKSDKFDIAVMLDADNIMAENCLEMINDAFHKGCHAVQCHRIAKNQNTSIASLDAISEEININLFRRGPAALGLSAAPLGSGMAFDFSLLRAIFSPVGILENPAEDREIEIQLMLRKLRMEFINNAFVLDEKVVSAGGFKKQRTRWLEAQMSHVLRFFQPDLRYASKTANYFNQLIRNLILPRLLFIALFSTVLLMFSLQTLFHVTLIYPSIQSWVLCMMFYFGSMFISVPSEYYNVKMIKAVIQMPVLMLNMLRALLKMKRNRKDFLHTSKTITVK